MLETAIFDEIQHVQRESAFKVMEAMLVACDKMDYITEHSSNTEGFVIFQESFTKPKKSESILTKVALAVPRAIYFVIKAIIDGFKSLFKGKKHAVDPIHVEHAFKLVDNLTSDPEVMKLVCGAVVGTAAAVGAFFKKKQKALKDKLELYRDNRAAQAHTRLHCESEKKAAEESYKEIVALYVKPDNSVGITLMMDLDYIRNTQIPNEYFRGLLDIVEVACKHADGYNTKSKFDDFMKRIKLDIENVPFLYQCLKPDAYRMKNYTFEEFNKALEGFTSTNFENQIEDCLTTIAKYIRMAYQSYEKNIDKAEKKGEKLEEAAYKKYCEDIHVAITAHFTFMINWCKKLVAFVNTATKEFEEKIKNTDTKKMVPYIGGDENKELTLYDREKWDDKQLEAYKNKAEEEAKKKKAEEDKKDNKDEGKKSDEKSSEEKKSDDDKSSKKEEKESDD